MKIKIINKKIKFSLLISLFLGISLQAQAYKLRCPAPHSIKVKKEKNQYTYFAKMRGARKINMHSLQKKNCKLDALSFEVASSSSDNRLFCTYKNKKTPDTAETLNLVASLKKGTTCVVTYPTGHKHPEKSYFECKD
jgi:hypothetical protein